MKKILFVIILFAVLFLFPVRNVHALGGEGDGNDGGGGHDFTSTTNPDGSVTVDCSNGGSITYDAPMGDFDGGDNTDTGIDNSSPPACVPDGQACPQTRSVRTMTSPSKRVCTRVGPRAGHISCQTTPAKYSSSTTTLDCCVGTCNDGICGNPPEPTQPIIDTPPTSTPGPSRTPTTVPSTTPGPTATPGPSRTPTTVPTSTPVPACGMTCERDADCAGAVRDACTACINRQCSVRPTATPTPIPFNPDACTCDTISYANLSSGREATITAFTKVTEPNANNARIVNVKFAMYEFNDLSQHLIGTRIAGPETVSAEVLSDTPASTKYRSVWKVQLPTFATGKLYKIGSQLDCRPKNTTTAMSASSNVLGQNTQSGGLLAAIGNFIARLFNVGSNRAVSTVAQTPTTAPTRTPPIATIQGDNLQLDTFNPTIVVRKTCDYVIFKGSY